MKIGNLYISHYNDRLNFSGHINDPSLYGEHAAGNPKSQPSPFGKIDHLCAYKAINSIAITIHYRALRSVSTYNQRKFKTLITFKRPVPGVAVADALAYVDKNSIDMSNLLSQMSKRKDLLDSQLYQVTNVVDLDKFKAHTELHQVSRAYVISSISFVINVSIGANKRTCECGHKSTTTNGWIKHKSSCSAGLTDGHKSIVLHGAADPNVLYDKLEARGLIKWKPVQMAPFVTSDVYDMLKLANAGDLGLSGEGLIAKLDELLDIMDDAREANDNGNTAVADSK